MIPPVTLRSLSDAVTSASAALCRPGEIIDAAEGDRPRYALFHGANSICSHKVRCTLAFHHLPYTSLSMNMFLGETYLPGYVRLRMVGCDQAGGGLVSYHSGSTSAAAGCDGAVVPTLVDWQTEAVIVDSKRICVHLDDQMPEAVRLRPPGIAADIDRQLAIVDNLPNYQMLMGRRIASEDDATSRDIGGSFSQRKVAWCDRYLAEHADDEPLARAYRAKRAKELSAATMLFAPDAMRAAYDRADAALVELERDLGNSGGPWLLGDSVTMADLFWGVELLRMKNVGVDVRGRDGRLRRVDRFAAAAEALPAIRTAVVGWPGAMF